MSVDTNNAEFQDALNLIQYTRQSVFLTGKAGTGKSTFLRYVCENTKKKYVVLAPTGIAAINAGGSTMHSFFKLPFHPLPPDDPNLSLQRGRIHEFFKYTKPHRKLLEQIELVIIDEISMVRADIIDAIDRILRVYSHNLREPFGGKQLLLVGDVFQLEPVVKSDERDILNRFYPTPYFFSARVFGQIDLVSIELQKVYRQTDPVFVSVLDHIRTNTAGAADLQLLNTRYGSQIEESEADMYITLATRRDTVDSINEKKLAELPGDPITFEGVIEGDFPESSLPTSQELVLKPGAQIIFIKNDFDRRWVNGTIGVISGIDEEEETIYVITDDGKECDVKRESWRNIRYRYNEKTKEFEYREGAVFANLFLADEINRTSPKTQSALLEAMEEEKVTVDGITHNLPAPFTVIATENPIGSSGTQMLPESQLDRFMICLSMGYPEHQDAVDILKNNGAKSLSGIQAVVTLAEWKKLQNMAEESYVSEEMYDYIVRLTENTRKHPMVRLGASPRASLALLRMAKAMAVMKGRDYVTPENVMDIYQEVLAHRIKLNMQAKAQGLEVSDILKQVFEGTKVVCVE